LSRISAAASGRRVSVTGTEFEQICNVVKLPVSLPNQGIPVPRKFGGLFPNPTKKSRIQRRREDDKPADPAVAGRIHAIARQAQELRERRAELGRFQRTAEENCQKRTFRTTEFEDAAAARWAAHIEALHEIATAPPGS
jgi:hypothetical protein